MSASKSTYNNTYLNEYVYIYYDSHLPPPPPKKKRKKEKYRALHAVRDGGSQNTQCNLCYAMIKGMSVDLVCLVYSKSCSLLTNQVQPLATKLTVVFGYPARP